MIEIIREMTTAGYMFEIGQGVDVDQTGKQYDFLVLVLQGPFLAFSRQGNDLEELVTGIHAMWVLEKMVQEL